MFNLIARFSVKFRWFIIIFWLIATPLAIKFLPNISSVTTSDNSGFLPANSISMQATKLAAPFGNKNQQGALTLVVYSTDGPLSTSDYSAIARLEDKLRNIKGVEKVHNLATSKDGKVTEIALATSVTSAGPEQSDALRAIGSMRSAFTSVGAPSSLEFHLTGQLASAIDANQSNKNSLPQIQDFSVVMILIILLIVFRSLLAPFITLLPAGLALAVSQPVIAETTKFGLQVSSIAPLLLVVLILGAGTDYGLFLVFRVREELRGGLAPKEAVVKALSRVGETITFSAATVMAALLSLGFATFGLYKGLGPSLAIGLAVMLILALTFLPAVLAILGRAAFWPTTTKNRAPKVDTWARIAGFVSKHPAAVLIIGMLMLGGLATGILGYQTAGFGFGTTKGSDSATGQQIITDHFPAATNNPQDLLLHFNHPIWSDLQVVHQIQTQLSSDPEFKSVTSPFNALGFTITPQLYLQLRNLLGPPSDLPALPSSKLKVSPILYQAYRATAQFISPDGQTIQFFAILKAGAGGSTAAMNAIPDTRTELTSVASGVGASQSGVLSLDAFSYDISNASNSDMAHIIPIVLLVIALLLAIMLRSLVAPWYLVLTVGLSYLAALGFAMIVFVHLGGNSGLFFILPFLMFIFSMALGEDYNILVMSRIREEAHEANTLHEAVIKAIGVTGNTVTSAGIILAGTFTILGTIGGNSSGDELQEIGYSVAFGILLDTFFVRTLLVPSIALLLGRWNWWPSALAYRKPAPQVELTPEPTPKPEPEQEPEEPKPAPPQPPRRPRRPRQFG